MSLVNRNDSKIKMCLYIQQQVSMTTIMWPRDEPCDQYNVLQQNLSQLVHWAHTTQTSTLQTGRFSKQQPGMLVSMAVFVRGPP